MLLWHWRSPKPEGKALRSHRQPRTGDVPEIPVTLLPFVFMGWSLDLEFWVLCCLYGELVVASPTYYQVFASSKPNHSGQMTRTGAEERGIHLIQNLVGGEWSTADIWAPGDSRAASVARLAGFYQHIPKTRKPGPGHWCSPTFSFLQSSPR